MRGYCGIGIWQAKKSENVGTLWRTASLLGASFIFTIGRKYELQASDTTKAYKSVPLYNYPSFDDFYAHMPHDCFLVGIELFPGIKNLQQFTHPERAIYLLGAEDHGLSGNILQKCALQVKIPTPHSLNVAVTGSIVLYDRIAKLGN